MTPSRSTTVLRAVAAIGVILSLARTGAADDQGLRASGIFLEPGNDSHIVVRTAWGLLDSRDAGRSWSYVCSTAFGLTSGDVEHYDVALASGGRVLVGTGSGGLWTSDNICYWDAVEPPVPGSVDALIGSDDTGSTFWTLVANVENTRVITRTYRSVDRGDSWTEDDDALPIDVLPFSAAAAPSDPNRLYVSGSIMNGPPILLTSTDAGVTWQMNALPQDAQSNFARPFIAFVHPTRPDAVVIRMDGSTHTTGDGTDHLLATPDAGVTWVDVYEGQGSLPGSTVSPDGSQLLISGPLDGVQAAPLDGIFNRRVVEFESVFPGPTWALATSATGIFVGTDSFADGGDGYVLGMLGSASNFTGLMSRRNIALMRCPNPYDLTLRRCEADWENVRSILLPQSNPGAEPSTDRPANDGSGAESNSNTPGNTGPSATSEPDTHSGATATESCACRFTRYEPPAGHRELAMLAGLLFVGRRRSRSSKRA